jgi:hypothetical protein
MEQLELTRLLMFVEGTISTFVERTSPGSFGVRKPLDLLHDGTNDTEKT